MSRREVAPAQLAARDPGGAPQLLTRRLRMRPLAEGDLDALCGVYCDPRVAHWIGHHSRADVAVELSFHVAHWARFGWGMWALEERASGCFIGDCGLQPLALVGPEVELAYDLDPRRWGAGLATEAARAALGYGLEQLCFERIIAVVKPANAASQRVLRKCGLAPAGERDLYGERMLVYETRGRAIT